MFNLFDQQLAKPENIGPTIHKLELFKLLKYSKPNFYNKEYSMWLIRNVKSTLQHQREIAYEEQAFDEYLDRREGNE